MKWGEVINPSDRIYICVDDAAAAAVVLAIGCGAYGLVDDSGKTLLPILIFGGDPHETFRSIHGCELRDIATQHARLARAARTAQYGSVQEIVGIEAALDGLPDKAARLRVY